MYERFYALQERPFELTPNPRYLFLSARHSEALTMLEYGACRRNGISLLLGDAGTGKTTLVHAALESQRGGNAFSVLLTNPALTRDEFFEFLAIGFGLGPDAAASKSRFLHDLTSSLSARHDAGGVSALIVDEGQCVPDALLEEIRLLSNIESATEKLLSIIMIGQPELGDRLNAPALRQFKQRVALRCTLAAFNLDETAAYIGTRLRVAGGEWTHVFSRAAIEAVHRASRGIPRTISVVCENALISGFALKQRPIGPDIIAEISRDFDLELPGAPHPVDPPLPPTDPGSQPPAAARSTFF